VALATLLAGCTVSLPFHGVSDDTGETFRGMASGMASGGTLHLNSSKGTSCEGAYAYLTERHARGTLTCSDGRRGAFELDWTGSHATGTGTLDGRGFTFTLG
jgi:hypothetical protein